jgi:hypothetical protein
MYAKHRDQRGHRKKFFTLTESRSIIWANLSELAATQLGNNMLEVC